MMDEVEAVNIAVRGAQALFPCKVAVGKDRGAVAAAGLMVSACALGRHPPYLIISVGALGNVLSAMLEPDAAGELCEQINAWAEVARAQRAGAAQ